MKYFIVLFVALALASAEQDFKRKSPEDLRNIGDECRKNYPLSPKELAGIWILDIANLPEVREHLVCLLKKVGIYSPDGGYDFDRVVAQFQVGSNEADLLAHIENCLNQVNIDTDEEDEYVYKGFVCILDSDIGKRFKAVLDPIIPDDVRKVIATL